MKRLLAVVAVAALGLAPALVTADVIRDSVGQRRAELDAMELKPFPAPWDGLAAWANGEPLKSADTDGKPVLIVNWASWKDVSVRALSTAQAAADKYGAQGLVVVGIHHELGWDGAEEAAKARGVTFRLAHDKDGAYRKALKVAKEPEFYVIDRAGHLRYASVTAGSVDEAAAEVTAEDAAKASDVPRIRRERETQALAQGRRTTEIRTNFELDTLPAVPPGYTPPEESAYENIKWPKMNEELGKTFGLLDQEGKNLKPKLEFAPLAWHPRQPETTGRVQVIYFWHPEVHLTYNHVLDQMDVLQEQHKRDIAITGAVIGVRMLDPSRNQGYQQQTDNEDEFEKLRKKWESFIKARRYSHALAADLAMTCLSTLNAQNGAQNFPVPGALIASTDGTIRWIGWTMDLTGRWNSDFRAALDKTIASDPGVQQRRKLDRAYIENKRR